MIKSTFSISGFDHAAASWLGFPSGLHSEQGTYALSHALSCIVLLKKYNIF